MKLERVWLRRRDPTAETAGQGDDGLTITSARTKTFKKGALDIQGYPR